MLKFWQWFVDFLVDILDYAQEKEESNAIKRYADIQKATAKLAEEIKSLEKEAEVIEKVYF